MIAQEDETKKFVDFNLDINDDFDFYLNEVIIGTADDKFDIDAHSTSKFLFHYFDNLRHDFGEEAHKIRNTIILNDLRTIEKLQSKNLPYFINRLLEVCDGEISSVNLFNLSQNQNDANELEIINDTIENLEIFKSYYSDIYANVGCVFQKYLQNASDNLIQKMQDDLRLNFFPNADLKNEQSPNEMLKDIW